MMLTKKKNRVLVLGIMVLALMMVGCQSKDEAQLPGEAQGKPVVGGEIVVAIPNAPSSLDGDQVTLQEVNDIMSHVYEGLFEFNAEYEPVPYLASGYEMANDNKTYVVTLRQGVKFHNGQEMTSADVMASFERWLRLNNTGQSMSEYLDSFGATGDYEVQFTFKEPYAPFLATISANVANQKLYIRPQSLVEKYANEIMTEHIGTGPYEFVEFVPDQYVKLSRFEGYVPLEQPSSGLAGARNPYADTIKFQFVSEQAVRIAGVQSGQYQFATTIPSDQYEVLKNDAKVQTYVTSPNYQLYLILNQGSEVLKTLENRQAIAYGLNMEELATLAIGDPTFWHLNGCLFPEGNRWYDATAGEGVYNVKDVAKAKELLVQGGYDGTPVTILAQKENYVYSQAAVALQSQLEAIGFIVDLQLLDNASVVEKRSQVGAWDIYVNHFKAPDPDPQVYGAWMGTNKWIGNWNDQYAKKMDDVFKRMLTETNQDARYKIVQEWYDLFYETVPYVKVADYDGLYIANKALQGYGNFTSPYYWNAWIQ